MHRVLIFGMSESDEAGGSLAIYQSGRLNKLPKLVRHTEGLSYFSVFLGLGIQNERQANGTDLLLRHRRIAPEQRRPRRRNAAKLFRLLVSYFTYERGSFTPTNNTIRLRFESPDNPFQFSRQNERHLKAP